jgi:hypothetical protein
MKPKLVVLFLFLSGTLHAQDVIDARHAPNLSLVSHFGHYIRTHKEIIAADALIVLVQPEMEE